MSENWTEKGLGVEEMRRLEGEGDRIIQSKLVLEEVRDWE